MAGDAALETSVRQNGSIFSMNFGELYWNSRLEGTPPRKQRAPEPRACRATGAVGGRAARGGWQWHARCSPAWPSLALTSFA